MGEPNKQPLVPLEHHFDLEVRALREVMEARFSALDKALDLAAKNLDAHLDNLNKTKETLKEQAASFFTKAEHSFFANGIEKELRVLRESKIVLDTKASQKSVSINLALSLAALLLGLLSALIPLIHK